ncbi:creatininase family protein [Dyadobacter luticola]|uniref:Creatininase family protein n=1 Tax=Dyadobacter luticola TaxID=1979387 RepID=A0A5R9KRT7_9BACT|nr:creatininase family protein [Dyadobacter luticola]TLU98933.1 creatininase family protein [Dyadobacter luticola]
MLFSNLSYPDINQQTEQTVIVLPLGAFEQHGPHMAVSTDTDIVTHIAKKAEAALPSQVMLCPTLPFGSSDHHLSFGGSISINPALYVEVIVDLVGSFLQNGFRRIVLLNGHGGNITPVRQALAILSKKYDRDLQPNIALVTYWELAGKPFAGEAPMESPALSHACEYETSMMLHLFPEKVDMEKAERAARPESNGYIPWEDDEPYRGVTLFKATAFISSNGSSGEPQKGTAEKGEHLVGKAVGALVGFLRDFATWKFLSC